METIDPMIADGLDAIIEAMLNSVEWAEGNEETRDNLISSAALQLEALWPILVGYITQVIQLIKQWIGLTGSKPRFFQYLQQHLFGA